MLLLTACAATTVIGAGCQTYAEARKDLPWSELREAPHPVVAWVKSLDDGMTLACVGR